VSESDVIFGGNALLSVILPFPQVVVAHWYNEQLFVYVVYIG